MFRKDMPTYDDAGKIKTYKKFARLEEDAEITEDNINEVALKHTAVCHNIGFDELKEILLRRN